MARLSAPRSSYSNGHVRPTTDDADEHEHGSRPTSEGSNAPDMSIPFPEINRRRTSTPLYDPTLLPRGSRSLSRIALQAFGLGNALAACIFSTVYLTQIGSTKWRLPVFFICLSVFHFLEFYTTARWNTIAAKADSFLLFNNGRAYTTAHALATVEMVLSFFFPTYQAWIVTRFTVTVGVVLVVLGQLVRSVAMAHAGTNFSHILAQEHKQSHTLVTDGVYRYIRHPAYFGFFWWAIGTQLLLGNKVCLVAYAAVLWKFFSSRIQTEEKFLIRFFGEDYQEYRKRTGTWIPLVR